MLEKALKAEERQKIRDFAAQAFERRSRLRSKMDEQGVELVRQDVRRYLRRQRTGSGFLSAILIQIAIRFAMKLIEKWAREYNERR